MKKTLLLIFAIFLLFTSSCNNQEDNPNPNNNPNTDPEPTEQIYFPPIGSNEWETLDADSMGWDTSKIPDLLDFLEQNGTRAFLVLKNGKIVIEEYFGKAFNGTDDFDMTKNWYWASAGKTLTGFMVGKAQEEGFLNINDKTSDYLGQGWTSLTSSQEEKITIKHQLSMTTGLNDGVTDSDCTDPSCLEYLAEPGMRWAYHNAPYTLLDNVISNATSVDFDTYFAQKLKDKIGMDGFWFTSVGSYNNVYYSTARSMARYGILILNNGKWEEEIIMNDNEYFNAMINTSQNLNLSYGYLWWLNGKDSFMVPGLQTVFNGSSTPTAPNDLFSALGKNGQLLNIVPSQNLLVIRMGDHADQALVSLSIQRDIWEKLSDILP